MFSLGSCSDLTTQEVSGPGGTRLLPSKDERVVCLEGGRPYKGRNEESTPQVKED